MYEILERDVPEQLGWIRAEGRTMTGSPREVYFADWDTAAATAEVCDIAFPVA